MLSCVSVLVMKGVGSIVEGGRGGWRIGVCCVLEEWLSDMRIFISFTVYVYAKFF